MTHAQKNLFGVLTLALCLLMVDQRTAQAGFDYIGEEKPAYATTAGEKHGPYYIPPPATHTVIPAAGTSVPTRRIRNAVIPGDAPPSSLQALERDFRVHRMQAEPQHSAPAAAPKPQAEPEFAYVLPPEKGRSVQRHRQDMPPAIEITPAAEPIPLSKTPTFARQAVRGSSLKKTLDDWSAEAGVDLIWVDETDDFLTRHTVSIDGPYEEAVRLLLKQYDDNEVRPVGTLYIDPADGRKTLVVETLEKG